MPAIYIIVEVEEMRFNMINIIKISLLSIVLTACAANNSKISVVQNDDRSLSCSEIEKEIDYLRDERKSAIENIFYTNRDLIDSATQRIRYLKTMYSYSECEEEQQQYTSIVLAGL